MNDAPAAVEYVPRHNAIGYTKITVDARHPRVPDLVRPGARMAVRYEADTTMTGRVSLVEGAGPRAQETVTVTVVGVKRAGSEFTYATAETVLQEGDLVVVSGTTQAVERFSELR